MKLKGEIHVKIAFFDSKEYDRQSFEATNSAGEFEIRFFETRLTPDTYKLAEGCNVVCVFVNDNINSFVIDQLYAMGIKLIDLRCAGYNNVDVEYAYGKVHVVRVPAYSPYAVAEHAMALLLTSIRRIHKAYIRTKDFNFSLEGMTGFDLHGKTVGVIGTGKIGRIFTVYDSYLNLVSFFAFEALKVLCTDFVCDKRQIDFYMDFMFMLVLHGGKVGIAAKTLANKSSSKPAKSRAGKTMVKHKAKNVIKE